ncbi:MAG: hypothetical protein ACYCOR_19175 [Acidobacteriaceae bacterium]
MARGYINTKQVITGAPLNVGQPTVFSKDFPMGEGWYSMTLRIGVTLAPGATAPIGPIAENIMLFVKNVLLRTDRGEIVCNLPGRALYKMNTIDAGSAPQYDQVAVGAGTYYITLKIPFVNWRMLRPVDTILDTSRYAQVTLTVSLGTVADLFVTPGNTAAVTATLDAVIERTYGAVPKQAKPIFHRNMDYAPPIDASVNLYVDLERSPDLAVARYIVHSCTGGTGGVPFSGTNSDAIQQTVTLKDQSSFIEDSLTHAIIQHENQNRYGLETLLSGIEVFEFCEQRRASYASALATGSKSLLKYTWFNQAGVAAGDLITVAHDGVRNLA